MAADCGVGVGRALRNIPPLDGPPGVDGIRSELAGLQDILLGERVFTTKADTVAGEYAGRFFDDAGSGEGGEFFSQIVKLALCKRIGLLFGGFGEVDGKFADAFAGRGPGIKRGEASGFGKLIFLDGLGEDIGDLEAEEFGIAGDGGYSDGEAGQHVGFGRVMSVRAGEFEDVAAAGAVDEDFCDQRFIGLG